MLLKYFQPILKSLGTSLRCTKILCRLCKNPSSGSDELWLNARLYVLPLGACLLHQKPAPTELWGRTAEIDKT